MIPCIQQADFTARLAQIIEPYGARNPVPLDLEIVETAALEGIRDIGSLVEECKAMNVSFTLDDFGTGYSTLDHLRRIPARALKIDRAFVRKLTDDDERTLIEAIIALGHTFEREVVAEGVETIEQVRWLKEAGCDTMQGFYFAKPMDSVSFDAWQRSFRPNSQWFESTRASQR